MREKKPTYKDAILAVLCAYGDQRLTMRDIDDRIKAWGIPHHDRAEVFRSLCEMMDDCFMHDVPLVDGTDEGIPTPGGMFWATDAGYAACRKDSVPQPTCFTYRNYKGDVGERRVLPIRVYHGEAEWHPGRQWLLLALDLDKGEDRTFAVKDIIGGFSG